MLRAALAATAALALALAALVAPATFAPIPAASAAASGSALLYPTGTTTCDSTATNPCRAAIEWRTSAYGPTAPGETTVKRRTMFSVFANAGEVILLGSSSMGAGSSDIVAWNPGLISETGVNTVANSALPTPSFSCAAQRTASGNAETGVLSTRAQEIAGPEPSAGGYKPCIYTAPTTGIYRVAFYGTAGGVSDDQAAQSAAEAAVVPASGTFAAKPTAVLAWDITVRSSTAATANIPGRVYTYSFAFYTGSNPRPMWASMYLNTTDGFRYLVNTNGIDGNGFAYYGNRQGFLDADGTPLNRNVVAKGPNNQLLEVLVGGTHLAPPEYPLSLEPLADETLAALSIPSSPTNPVLNSVTYTGKKTSSGSYVNHGGTFTIDTGTSGTYEIVISSSGTNFDPGLPENATIRGVVDAAGVYPVAWDGKDNAGVAFPVGDDYAVKASLRGGEYHAPMLDIESSVAGGPSITLVNPPNNTCPFTNVPSTGTNCTTAFFDDRGYVSSNGTAVGTPGDLLCSAFGGDYPDPLFSDPVTGFDSASDRRAFGLSTAPPSSNEYCPGDGTLGDAKGLDIWTFFPSAVKSTQADVLPLPSVPVAVNDTDATTVGTTITRAAEDGVLINDSGEGLEVASHTQPAVGTLTINADGSYSYVPSGTASGVVTATYTLRDDAGQTTTATLTITVSPKANPDAYSTDAEVPLPIAVSTLTDDDLGSTLTVTSLTDGSHGTVVDGGDGTVTYTPADGFSGVDTFTYTISDGARTAVGTVTVTVRPTAGADSMSTDANQAVSITQTQLTNDDLGSGLEVTAVTQPAHGTSTLNGDGSVTYSPDEDFSGSDSFSYTVTDDAGQTATATVTVTVRPTAGPDSMSTDANQPVSITQTHLTNDDAGSGLEVTAVTQPSNGTATLNGDGSVTYAPDEDFSGSDSFSYTVTDDAGQTATATVTVTVAPTAGPDSMATDVNQSVSLTEAGLTDDDAGSNLKVTAITQPAHGTAVLNANRSVSYTPDEDFSGSDSFSYTVTDDAGQTATATVTVTVTPTAGPDSMSTDANQPVSITQTQLTNDDAGSGLEVTAVTQPSNGTSTLNGDGSVTYAPDEDFSGSDSFSYTVTDAAGQTVTATISVTVRPTAGADSMSTTVNQAVSLTEAELTNDDAGSGLEVTAITQPSNGTATLNDDGSVTYAPTTGFSGSDSFSYTVTDDAGQTVTATVSVTVAPTAGADAASTPAQTAVTLTESELTDDDAGSALKVTAVTQPTHGTTTLNGDRSVTYTPDDGFSGSDSFSYTVTDAAGQTVTATVTVTVTPTAGPDAASTPAETAATLTQAELTNDDLGTGLEVTGVTQPAHGTTVRNADGSVTYTPEDGFSGEDTFSYTVTDDAGGVAIATVTITVTPTAVDDTASTTSGTPVTLAETSLTNDDTGSVLHVTDVDSEVNGTAVLNPDGSVTFTPTPGFSGEAGFSYTVTDEHGQTAAADVVVTVTPTAGDDTLATLLETEATISAAELLDDDRGTGIEVTAVGTAAHGTTVLNADGSISYTPEAGYSGFDTFSYTITDDAGQTVTAHVQVTVQPQGGDDIGTTPSGVPLVVATPGVLANDGGTELEVIEVVTAPTHGDVTVLPDGSYTYTPEAGFSGVDTFVYRAQDGEGHDYTQTVTITVTPVAVDDSVEGEAEQPIVVTPGGLTDDDRGIDVEVTGTTDGDHGTVTLGPDGTVTYTPEPGFSGEDTFTYTITGAGGSSTATVTVLVRPTAPDDEIRTRVGVAVDSATGRLLENARGTGLAVHEVTQPQHGTVVVDPDGTFHYTPAPGYVGEDAFTYTVIDEFGSLATGTVRITVVPELPFTGADPRVGAAAAVTALLAGGLLLALMGRRRRARHAA